MDTIFGRNAFHVLSDKSSKHGPFVVLFICVEVIEMPSKYTFGFQIVVGSFLPSYQMEQKNKKPRVEAAPALAQTPPAVPISSTDTHSSEQGQHSSVAPRTTNIVTSAYNPDQSWASPAQSIPDSARTPSGDVKVTASGA